MTQQNSPITMISFDRFWSNDGTFRQKSACALLVTLAIFFGMSALFLYHLIDVFSYRTVDAQQAVQFDIQPPITSINTYGSNGEPSYMLALSVLQSGCAVNSSISLEAFYVLKSSTSTVSTDIPITLETCTDQHFSRLPGKLNKIFQWTLNTVLCLPLNQNYNIGGSTLVSGIERYFTFRFNCPSTCGTTTNCGTVEFFTENAQVNSENGDDLYEYYMDRKSIIVSNPTIFQNIYEIDESKVNSNNYLLFSSNTFTRTLAGGKFHTDVPTTNATTTTLNFKRSDKTITHHRSFLKLFDVFAYIGGLIQIVFIVFFFMPSFGRFLNQMMVAQAIFRTKEGCERVNFLDFIKQSAFSFISYFCNQPDWEVEAKRNDYKQSVSKMTDTVMLQKRILFLQEAITILLQRHHLKGIHLVHNLSKEEFDKNSKQHALRDRVIYYLGKYSKDSNKGKRKNPQQDSSVNSKEHEILRGSSSSDIEKPGFNKKGSAAQLGSSLPMNRSEELRDSKIRSQGSKGIRHEADISDELSVVNEQIDDFEAREGKFFMQQQLEYIGELSEAELNEPQLTVEVQSDLLRLLQEAQMHEGDLRSKKICEKLQGWLKKGIEKAARKYKNLHPEKVRSMMKQQ